MNNQLSDLGFSTLLVLFKVNLNHFLVRLFLSRLELVLIGCIAADDIKRKARSVSNLQNIGLFPTQKPIFKITRVNN